MSLDGGFVHSAPQTTRRRGRFEVIVAKAVPAEGKPKCFGYVQTYDTQAKRRLWALLASQGLPAAGNVTFITDGGDDVRALPRAINPEAECLLDWFHVTMRITVLGQLGKGLRPSSPDHDDKIDGGASVDVARHLERLKWFLWHGNVKRALLTLKDLVGELDGADPGPERRKLLKALRKFDGYIRGNAGSIPNYGERHRGGEAISSAIAESTVNQVIAKRMVKKQQMRWTPAGAHLLIQVRTTVINDDLADVFHRWYPGFTHTTDHQDVAA